MLDEPIKITTTWDPAEKRCSGGLFGGSTCRVSTNVDLGAVGRLQERIFVAQHPDRLGNNYQSGNIQPDFVQLSPNNRCGGGEGETLTVDTEEALKNRLEWLGLYVVVRDGVSRLSEVNNLSTTIKVPGQDSFAITYRNIEAPGCIVGRLYNNGESFWFDQYQKPKQLIDCHPHRLKRTVVRVMGVGPF